LHKPPEIDDATTYRQVSAAAVWALLLGVASALAFVGPLFLFLPVAAIGLGLLALSKIQRSDGALTGARLAKLALFLAVAFTIASFVRDKLRDRMLEEQAAAVTQRWLQRLAEGDIEEARAMLSGEAANSLAPPPKMGQPAPSAADTQTLVIEKLRSDPLTKAVAEEKSFSILPGGDITYDGPRTIVHRTVAVGGASQGEQRRASVQLTRHHAYEASGLPWRIDRWTLLPSEATGSVSK
jgi:hypothetical protein